MIENIYSVLRSTGVYIYINLNAKLVNNTAMDHPIQGNPGVPGSAAATIAEKAAPVLNVPIQPITWTKVVELCYSLAAAAAAVDPISSNSDSNGDRKRSICFCCEKQEEETTPFKLCGQCQVAKYCSRECQLKDWKKRHKCACTFYQRMIGHNVTTGNSANETMIREAPSSDCKTWTLRSDEIKCQVRHELFGKIRFYACPYAVVRYSELGRGFLFVQANHTLAITSLALPMDCNGYRVGVRSCSVHYLTAGEYDQEVCRDDFEMTMVRPELREAIEQYDPTKQVVILMRFRCGHIALGTGSLVPDYKLYQQLGRDYIDPKTDSPMGSLQLNLDE